MADATMLNVVTTSFPMSDIDLKIQSFFMKIGRIVKKWLRLPEIQEGGSSHLEVCDSISEFSIIWPIFNKICWNLKSLCKTHF